MKKIVINSLIITFLLLAFFCFISGCAKKQDKIVIKFSSWGSESEIAILKPIIKEFEAKNPDIKIDFIHIPKNYFQKLHLLIASNLVPDVIFLNNINGSVYAGSDILLDLSPYLEKDDLISYKDFFPKSLDALKFENQLYAIPRDISNLVIYYNKDIFDKNHVPYPKDNWTFEEYLSTAQKLTKDFDNDGRIDRYGTSFEELPLFWLPFLWSNNGGIISPDLKSIIVNKPKSLEAIQFYADLKNKYHVAPSKSETGGATMAQLFMQGKIAMQINGRWSVPRYRKDLEFNWDIAKFPRGKGGSVVDSDASGWAISKSSKYPEQSWRFIRFLADKKTIEEFTKSGLIVPARVGVANSDVFISKTQKPANSRLFTDIIPESIPTPTPKNAQEIMDTVNNTLEPVFNGQKRADEVFTDKVTEKLKKLSES